MKMIKTKRILSITTKLPKDTVDTKYINVLTWHDENHKNGSKYHVLSPYHLRTDGCEQSQYNEGDVLFENFWQGSKVWPVMYDTEIWAHHALKGKKEHLWFKYKCENNLGSEVHFKDNEIQNEYYKWRKAIFACQKPIRYPNGLKRQKKVLFTLSINEDGQEEKFDYIKARKEIYIKEYCRLVKKLPVFNELLNFLKNGKTLVICEIDVPDNEVMTIDKLEKLTDDKSIKYGHGLCLALELLRSFNPSSS